MGVGAGCGLRSGCVGFISRSSVLAGREAECRKVRRHFREMFVAFLFVVFSGTISTIWRGWPQLMASWRWWPHGPAAQYDWGNVGSISVRSFLEYSFHQLAWVAPIDCQLALVAPWPRNGPRVINCLIILDLKGSCSNSPPPVRQFGFWLGRAKLC